MSTNKLPNREFLVKEVTVSHWRGIDPIVAAAFVKFAERFVCDIFVEKDGEKINGKSIMGLMMLAAGPGSKVTLHVRGTDAIQTIAELEAFVQRKFDVVDEETRFHTDDPNSCNKKVLTFLTYPSDASKDAEHSMNLDPDLKQYIFHTCFLDPAKELESFADQIIRSQYQAGLRSAPFSSWNLRGGELIKSHPGMYEMVMLGKMKVEIEKIQPHVVLFHYGDAFHMAFGILECAIHELQHGYVDIVFIITTVRILVAE